MLPPCSTVPFINFVIVESKDPDLTKQFSFYSMKRISVEAVSTIAMALKTNHSLQILKWVCVWGHPVDTCVFCMVHCTKHQAMHQRCIAWCLVQSKMQCHNTSNFLGGLQFMYVLLYAVGVASFLTGSFSQVPGRCLSLPFLPQD